MANQIEVLAQDISKDEQGHPTELTGTTRILTYKSFLYLNANPDAPRYKLLYQVDEKGNEIPGSPNLQPQHRTTLPQKSVNPVVDAGQPLTQAPIKAEVEQPAKRRGRPKFQTEATEHVA